MEKRRQISGPSVHAEGESWPNRIINLQDRAAVLKSRKDNLPGLAMGMVR